ncbi:MAG: nucleotide exchange factor GrpE [Limisphaerales bacterium]
MSEPSVPRVAKWPFFLGDALLLVFAGTAVYLSAHPLGIGQVVVGAGCVGLAAWVSITPFVLEYRAAIKMAEASGLTNAVAQIKNLGQIAKQINSATNHWQNALDESAKTVAAAREISERMTAEAKAFAEFMQKANDSEKAHLRLEVEKLRRAEADWLQILTHVLDHVHALCLAAAKSGQPHLVEQLGTFQNACRDAVRRVGLVPFVVAPEELFNTRLHQLVDANTEPPPNVRVAETLATGYTFQGQLLRKALVTLQPANSPSADAAAPPSTLELEASGTPPVDSSTQPPAAGG